VISRKSRDHGVIVITHPNLTMFTTTSRSQTPGR